MSHALYSTCLIWHRLRGGVAKLHGRQLPLQAPPLPNIEAIDYVPEVGRRRITPEGAACRDMTPAEVREADAALMAVMGG